MKILTPGHRYQLAHFENPDRFEVLQFIEKTPKGDEPTLRTVFDGTTNEEVLSMLIDRISFLNKIVPSRESSIALTHIETAQLWLQKRTSDRKARGVVGTRKQ